MRIFAKQVYLVTLFNDFTHNVFQFILLFFKSDLKFDGQTVEARTKQGQGRSEHKEALTFERSVTTSYMDKLCKLLITRKKRWFFYLLKLQEKKKKKF